MLAKFQWINSFDIWRHHRFNENWKEQVKRYYIFGKWTKFSIAPLCSDRFDKLDSRYLLLTEDSNHWTKSSVQLYWNWRFFHHGMYARWHWKLRLNNVVQRLRVLFFLSLSLCHLNRTKRISKMSKWTPATFPAHN